MVNSVAIVQYLVITVLDPKQFDNIMFTNACANVGKKTNTRFLASPTYVDRYIVSGKKNQVS